METYKQTFNQDRRRPRKLGPLIRAANLSFYPDIRVILFDEVKK